MARVVLENVTKSFPAKGGPIHALRDFSLTVEAGEWVILVGPSAAGKSTTLRLIAGLETLSAGRIWIDGRLVNDLPPRERDLAMVFQHHALFPHLTASQNMAFGLKLRKLPRPEIERRVREAAQTLGLLSCLDRKPAALSGGERQRVALGRAIVRQPKVFLFDEPLSHLDASKRAQMRAELSRLHTRLGATFIHVTHDQLEAMTLGDRLVVIHDGRIQQVAAPLELYRAPANLFVAGFIGSPPMNFFHGRLLRRDGRLCFQEQTDPGADPGWIAPLDPSHPAPLAACLDKSVILGLRPEHMQRPAPAVPTPPTLSARIEIIEPIGAEVHLHLATSAHRFIARLPEAADARVGDPAALCLDLRQARFFDPGSGRAIS